MEQGQLETREILRRLDTIEDLPTLSPIAAKVNDLVGDADTSIRKLSEVIEKDQAITARLLKLVNSAFFGLSTRVGNIPHSLVLLGFNTVRNAVLSLSVIDSLSQRKTIEGFDIRDFWRHSIAVAVTSRFLAERTRLHPVDDSFTAGLLHDIGKLLLSQYFPDLFRRVWTSMHEEGLSFSEAEKRDIPINHAQIGSHLARRYKLPSGLADAIRFHHDPRGDVPQLNLLVLVHLADGIVNGVDGITKNAALTHIAGRGSADKLVILLETRQEWGPTLEEETAAACGFFLEGVGL